MTLLTSKNRILTAAVCAVIIVLGGCGGAQARKARHIEKGQAFLAAGNFEKARVEFRNALQIAPNDSEARYENGVVDEKLGNPREAAQFYQGAIDAQPDHLNARVGLGRLFLFGGAPERAIETVKPGFARHPDDARLLAVRAAARLQLKDEGGALEDAERAVKLEPNNEDAVAVLAGIYKSKGENDKAEALLQSSIKLIPKTEDLRLALAQLYATTGHAAEAGAVLVEMVRLHPDEKAHRLRLAQYYARANQLDDAERVLRDGIKDLPKERDLKIALVDFLGARRSREAAEKELATLIAADPKDFQLKFALGQFYEQGKEFAKAETIYKDVIAAAGLDAPGITARDRLAALRIQQNDTPAADKLIGEVLAKNPRDNDALIMRGNLALVHKDPKAAIADLRAVLRDQPNSIGVMRSLARAHLANGEPALAEETMRRAVDANPQDPQVRLDLAQLLAEVGKPAQAAPVINELVKQQPNNIQALDAQLKIALAGKDLVTAKSAADALVVLQPKQPLGIYYQGIVAEESKHVEEAMRLYSAALDLQPDGGEPLQGVTRILVATNRLPDALKRLDDVIARFPKLAVAANLKGEVMISQHRAAEAVPAFRTAIEREPKWWTPYRNLAAAESETHDDTAAAATLQEGILKATPHDALETQLALLYERSGEFDQAIAVYETELRHNPASEVAANNLAMLLVTYKKDPGNLDRAKLLASRFATSSNPDFLDTYGWVLYKRGEVAPAVAALQAALVKSPDSPVGLYHLGMAQAQAGQTDAARDSLSRSLKAGKDFSGRDEAKATLDKLAKISPSVASVPRT
jgi:tetratricopeptide (TPR) repeat protein